MTDHDLYYAWLVDLIDDGRGWSDDYSRVLHELFHTIFTFTVHRDRNRAAEGTDLRYIYAEEIGADPDFWTDFLPVECTVLEMMVALARKWDNELMFDVDNGHRLHEWFFIMLKNCGLDRYPNRLYDEDSVHYIIERFLNRGYERDGRGGLFRTKDQRIDMRETELWYQLNYFVSDFLG